MPEGRTAADNEVVREHGTKPELAADAQPHWDLIKKYDIIDFELGNKITGAGFPVYKSQGARLQRALINFFLDEARDAGYTEMQPPILVNEASGYGTGQLPDKEGQMYHDAKDNLYLIPTAEVPITNLYRDEIIAARQAAHPQRRLHALLPPRGRLVGRRRARPQPPAPVRQGGDRADHGARAELRRPSKRCWPTSKACCKSWSSPTACCASAAAI